MKFLRCLALRLTRYQHSPTCWDTLRFAAQEQHALIRSSKPLALVAALLLAVLAVGAGAGSAAAHGNHSHHVSIGGPFGSASSSQAGEILQLAQDQVLIASDAAEPGSPDRHGKSDCCCGNIVCHAGVTTTSDAFPVPRLFGARVLAEPASGHPRRSSSGLDRPPRSLDIGNAG